MRPYESDKGTELMKAAKSNEYEYDIHLVLELYRVVLLSLIT